MEYIIRHLETQDLVQYRYLLGQLTEVKYHTAEEMTKRLTCIMKNSYHRIFVITNKNRELIGCGTLLIEPKFIRGMTYLAHIEDVCIDQMYRKKGYGKILIDYLIRVADDYDCYKISLNCSDVNVRFYASCGFIRNANQMTKSLLKCKL